MNRQLSRTAVLLAVLLILAPSELQADESQVLVHFVVVGNQTRDGLNLTEALDALTEGFDRLAGGYTSLGATTGGWMPASGAAETEGNHSFLVSAARDLTVQIEALVAKEFTESPFILVWPGRCNYPPEGTPDPAAQGKQLVEGVWKALKAGDISALQGMMAPGFQSVHSDGSRSAAQELELIKGLDLGSYSLTDFLVTRNGPVLLASYFVAVKETIRGQVLSKKPAARLTVFLETEGGWKWIGHANLNPLK